MSPDAHPVTHPRIQRPDAAPYAELEAAGHEVSVEFDINDAVSIEAVRLWQPELIIAPFLKRAIPGGGVAPACVPDRASWPSR